MRPLLLPSLDEMAVVSKRWGRRDRIVRRVLAVADAGALVAAAAIAAGFDQGADPLRLVAVMVLTMPAWILLLKLYGLYDRPVKRVTHSGLDDVPRLFHALLVGGLGLWFLLRALPWTDQLILSESVAFGVVAMFLLLAFRGLVVLGLLGRLGPERVLVVGNDPVIRPLVKVIERHPELGLTPIGVVADGLSAARGPAGLKPLGPVDELERVITDLSPDRVFICSSALGAGQALDVIDSCRRFSLKVGILPAALELFGPSVEINELHGIAVLEASPPVLSRSSRLIKRLFDVVVASFLLILTSPALVAGAIMVRLSGPGPVIFRQQRIGRGARRFELLKLRTMVADAEAQREELMAISEDPNWLKLESDPRITRVGAFLRRSSIDELPQLVNVLKGDMSIVGPRPLPEHEDAAIAGWGRGRLDLTPGITGLWQVLGRTSIPFDEMVKLDYMYVTNWSLWLDLKLLLRTMPAVIGGRGVN